VPQHPAHYFPFKENISFGDITVVNLNENSYKNLYMTHAQIEGPQISLVYPTIIYMST
jgi:hypothetical protein